MSKKDQPTILHSVDNGTLEFWLEELKLMRKQYPGYPDHDLLMFLLCKKGAHNATLSAHIRKLHSLAKEAATQLHEFVPSSTLSTEIDNVMNHMSKEFVRRKTGDEMAQMMESFVNVLRDREDNRKFVEYIVHRTHRTLNQALIGLFLCVLQEEAKQLGKENYDARNEAAVKICFKLSRELQDVYLPVI